MRWGLLPRWAKRATGSSRPIINARAETIAEKPTFRDALRQRVGPVRRPMRVVLRSGAPFAFAGIWSLCSIRPMRTVVSSLRRKLGDDADQPT